MLRKMPNALENSPQIPTRIRESQGRSWLQDSLKEPTSLKRVGINPLQAQKYYMRQQNMKFRCFINDKQVLRTSQGPSDLTHSMPSNQKFSSLLYFSFSTTEQVEKMCLCEPRWQQQFSELADRESLPKIRKKLKRCCLLLQKSTNWQLQWQ